MTDDPKPAHCPECRSQRIVPISYGLVEEWDEDLERDLAEGKYVLGGDVIFPDAKQWACLACGHRWGSFHDLDPAEIAWHIEKALPNVAYDKFPPQARISLEELGLSNLSLNCLESEGITTAVDLCIRTAQELLEIRGFKQQQLQEVQERLAAVNLWLCGDNP